MRYYHDLEVYHRKRDLHGMTVMTGWVKDREDRSWKRTLYLMPAGYYGQGTEHLYWLIENFETCGVALDAGKDIGAQDFAYGQASYALQKMGMVDSLTNRHFVIGIINDHLDDLTLMPPRPSVEQCAAADVIITNVTSGKQHEAVVLEDA